MQGTMLWTLLTCRRLRGVPALMISPSSDGDREVSNNGMCQGSGAEAYLKSLENQSLVFLPALKMPHRRIKIS